MDPLLTFLIQQMGPALGVLVFLIVGLARGWIWTNRAVTSLVNELRGTIERERQISDQWREAASLAAEASREDRRQLTELLKSSEPHTGILRSLMEVTERRREP